MSQQRQFMKLTTSTNRFEIRPLKNGGEMEENDNVPANKDSFTITWIRQGSGTLYMDMNLYVIKSDTIYYIKPGQAARFDAAEELDGYTISFSADFLAMEGNHEDQFYRSALFNPLLSLFTIKVEEELKPEMLGIVEKMMREYSGAFPCKDEILRGLLKIFLVYLKRQQVEPDQQLPRLNQAGLVSRFFSLLEKNFANRKMVSDYARDLSVTPNYLNETVKKTSGFPASYHIRQRITLEAKRKAAYVRMTMKEIAYDLGFDDISHFSKYFKKTSGISFTDFKKEISGQFSFVPDFNSRRQHR
jgi:AraC family transcriptional regulator, transcriptional activator of pobA